MVEVFKSAELSKLVEKLKEEGKSIGFVATMGALHEGHLDLITQSKKNCDYTICSIFVNPLQFNNSEDFEKYPNTIIEDKKFLEKYGCDCVFLPDRKDVFPEQPNLKYDFGTLSKWMEGEFRPKHFEGVAAVVEKLFSIIKPDKAYFGEKDYQQLAIIRWLVNEKSMPIEVVACETVRHESGLAMSSRNLRLSIEDRKKAAKIYKTMSSFKEEFRNGGIDDILKNSTLKLEQDFDLEYFMVADEETLVPFKLGTRIVKPRLFVSAFLSGVRLIDNISLID
jgi:pantoate--beta-alanine ligase